MDFASAGQEMSFFSSSKAEYLQEIIRIAVKHKITASEINDAFNSPHQKNQETETLMKVFAYLSGIFIFSGVSIYIGTFWPNMTSILKILFTFGSGLVLYVMAILLSFYQQKNVQMLTPLFLTAAFFQTIGFFVTINEFNGIINFKIASVLIFGILFTQQMLTFFKIKRPSLLFTAILFWCLLILSLLNLTHVKDKIIEIVIGGSLIGIGYFLNKHHYKALTNFWIFIGSLLFLNGVFDVLRNSKFEMLFLGISGLMLYGSMLIRNRALLFTSTVSTLGYIAYFTHKHFMNSAAWPILLIVAGLICFGAGIIVIKIAKKYN